METPFGVFSTRAQTSRPFVTSGSSPASLRTAQKAVSPSMRQISGAISAAQPFGVRSESDSGACPVSSSSAAPAAARAAQVPVV